MTLPHHESVEGGDQRPWVDSYIDQIEAVIRDHGWAVQGVFATKTSDIKFDFAYTVGLMKRGCTAELLITGLPMRSGADILNQIAAEMLNNSQMIPPAEWTSGNGYVLKAKFFIPRQGSELHLGVARAYYNRPDVPVAQYVWPDKDNHYPWDEDWDSSLLQPYGNSA